MNDKYYDFQYRAVNNIWSLLEFREKLKFTEYYKDFLKELKEVKEKYDKAQKSLYSGIQQTERLSCRDECTCKESNLNNFNSSVEKESFLKVCRKVNEVNSKICDDFNILCNKFVRDVCESEINRLKFWKN